MALGTPTRRMPIQEDVRDFLGDLLGKAVSVVKRPAEDFDTEEHAYLTGRYIDDKNRLIGACVVDIQLAAFAGAALAMIPVVVAHESIAAGTLSEGLRDNIHEVINIVSAMLNGPSVPHLRLDDVVEGVPDDVRDLATRAAGRRHYDVTVVDYGHGQLALIGA